MLACQLTCGVEVSVHAHIGAPCQIAHTVGPRDISCVCIAPALRQVVRLGTSWPVLCTCLCSYTPQLVAASPFSVPIWKNISTCGCLMAPQGGRTLTTRVLCTPHHNLSNSHKLVRAPRPLQRLQALCPAHRLHTVPSARRFRRAPLAPSQVTSATLAEATTQLSFAEFLERCILLRELPRRPCCLSPPHFWMQLRRLFHTSLSHRTSPPTPARGVPSQMRPVVPTSAHDVLCPT